MDGNRMRENRLLKVQEYGQSIWLDYIRRGFIISSELQELIDQDGLRGVTVNPSILEKAISGSHDYDESIQEQARQGKEPAEIYETLAIEDVKKAADHFRPLYEQTGGRHGFVSLEVSPYLARKSEGTIEEAMRFWNKLDRPNVMIKVPATEEGLDAIRRLTAIGINVNVTLLYGLPRYRQVAEAYIQGLEDRVARGEPVHHVDSVASFFLSRIDVLVDPKIEKLIEAEAEIGEVAQQLYGEVAISSAKVAYQIYRDIFESQRFLNLLDRDARIQRLLWASTSSKNPVYSDVKYVDALIGPDTVNTLPLETLNAFRDHGNPAERLEEDIDKARLVLDELPNLGIDIDAVTQQLEEEGIEKFAKSYDNLMTSLQDKIEAAEEEPSARQTLVVGEYQEAVDDRIDGLAEIDFGARFWRKDPTLWKSGSGDREAITNALGWLHVAEKMEEIVGELEKFADEVRLSGFQHIVHLGMGGSSLAPLTFERTFEPGEDGLPLIVVDTTDPTTVLQVENRVPLLDTLFIVASKSGTTAETRALGDYYFYWVSSHKRAPTGSSFVAVTDPGSSLVQLGQELEYRRVFLNFPDIGGRYSALSYFGMVPAVLMDLDVEEILLRAQQMQHACASCVPAKENPGMVLGAALGELALQGRNKLTLLLPESISTLEMWLEQLLAESTGKEETGILPVAGEPVGDPSVYGEDRLFAYIYLQNEKDEQLDERVNALQEAGHPIIKISLRDRLDLAQEFYRWEIATAVAGAILGINPFDQPNVQESKRNTDRLLDEMREKGQLPIEDAQLSEGSLKVYYPDARINLAETLRNFLAQADEGDYIALMAYLTEEGSIEYELQAIRELLRDGLKLATTLGFGPRFLHSTGQFHKGGPDTGLFIQLTSDKEADPQIPDESFTFGAFQLAQAIGDLQALKEHDRRIIRVHLENDVIGGLEDLKSAIEEALAKIKA